MPDEPMTIYDLMILVMIMLRSATWFPLEIHFIHGDAKLHSSAQVALIGLLFRWLPGGCRVVAPPWRCDSAVVGSSQEMG